MEYVLRKTDIFDESIDEKFSKAIVATFDNLNIEHTYKLTVSFHVDLLNDPRFEEFIVPVPSKTNKGTKKDKIYEVMSYQLKKLEKVLEEKGMDLYSTTIQGDLLQEVNSIKIEINEEKSESILIGRGKNKKPMGKVSSIIPSLPYTRQNVTNLASERISELYYKLMGTIKNKKIMSEILGIEETEDENQLFKAFANQYGALWLTTSEREKELLDRLKERSLFVLNKYNKMERWNMYLEIQQLKKLGLNKSQIARRLGISRNTVYKYINMTPEEFEDMLEHMEVRQKKLDCIKEKLITWLKQYPDISSAQIHDWIKERYPDLTVGESTVRCYVSQLRKEYSIPKIKVTRQYEAVEDPPMGQQMQVDFGQVTVRNTFHQPQKLWFMACVLSHSRYKFVYWLDRPFTTADVIQAHEQAFVFYGGLPQEIVYDQDHLILVSENGGDLIYTKEFANYLKHRAFKVRMCRKGDPESKGKVENVVGYVKKNFARHRTYYNLAQWSEDCLAWLERTGNGKVHQTTKKIPAEVFQQERLYLRPVQEKYHLNEAKASITRVVRKDNTILYAGNRYSVPLGTYDDKGKSVGLKIQDDTLTIYDWETGEVLAQHAICHEKGKLIQNTNHKRDRSKGIQALMQQVAGRFPEPDQATLFLKEIYQRKQRYMRDQLQKIQEVMNKANPHSGVIGQALAYCLTYQLYSAAAFSDAVQHFMQQAQRQQAHQHEHQPEIKPTVLGHQSHSQVKAEIRDPQVYIRILEGESLCQKA